MPIWDTAEVGKIWHPLLITQGGIRRYYPTVIELAARDIDMATNTQNQDEQDREASHIAYAISTAIVNSKFNDEERALVRQLVTDAAQQLSIKMALLLPPVNGRPRYNIAGYVKTSNSGQRELPLALEETTGASS